MLYNLANPYEVDRCREYLNTLCGKQAIVEVKEKKKTRTSQQNKYLHTILSYFACEYGCTAEEAKLDFYKRTCNKEIFVKKVINKFGKEVETVRSSADLDTGEMTTSIERFRNWAVSVASIYIPSPYEHEFLIHCQQVIEQNREFV